MPIPKPKIPAPPRPTRSLFDPYNSSSTGHQVDKALLAGTTVWRDSRTYKLARQFGDRTGGGGDGHVQDQLGGSRQGGRQEQDIRRLLNGSTKRKRHEEKDVVVSKKRCSHEIVVATDTVAVSASAANVTDAVDAAIAPSRRTDTNASSSPSSSPSPSQFSPDFTPPPTHPKYYPPPPTPPPPQIFTGLTIYINGSTSPLISDHKLKQVFTQHGGSISLALARRTVTHVILGETNLSRRGGGCGGGLAAGKMQREITRVRGKGVKYVTADWVVESIERGRRVEESKYAVQGVNLGGRSVRGYFKEVPKKGSKGEDEDEDLDGSV